LERKKSARQNGRRYWLSCAGNAGFPHATSSLSRNATFFRVRHAGVVDDGADYEYRYVEKLRGRHSNLFKGMRVPDRGRLPELGAILRSAYEQVRSTGASFLVRGRLIMSRRVLNAVIMKQRSCRWAPATLPSITS